MSSKEKNKGMGDNTKRYLSEFIRTLKSKEKSYLHEPKFQEVKPDQEKFVVESTSEKKEIDKANNRDTTLSSNSSSNSNEVKQVNQEITPNVIKNLAENTSQPLIPQNNKTELPAQTIRRSIPKVLSLPEAQTPQSAPQLFAGNLAPEGKNMNSQVKSKIELTEKEKAMLKAFRKLN